MPAWLMKGLKDGASPIMEQLIMYREHSLMFMLMILKILSYMMVMVLKNKNMSRFMLEGQLIETTWTIAPAVIQIFFSMPSLRLMYLLDEVHNTDLKLKVMGHQLYWKYEYTDFTKMEIELYMTQIENYQHKYIQHLETDNRIVVPMNARMRTNFTAADVLHS